MDQKEFFVNKDDHAGEMETSVIMYLRPNLVRPLTEASDGKSKKFRFKAMQEGWAWAERKWMQVTADTGVGDPRQASAEKGEKYFKAVTCWNETGEKDTKKERERRREKEREGARERERRRAQDKQK